MDSIAREEFSHADLLRAESEKIQAFIKMNATPAQMVSVNTSVAGLINNISGNNSQVIRKLGVSIEGGKPDPNDMPTNEEVTARKKALTDIIRSIADEENGIADVMNSEADKIRKVALDSTSTPDDIVSVNNSARSLMGTLTSMNSMLAEKLNMVVHA